MNVDAIPAELRLPCGSTRCGESVEGTSISRSASAGTSPLTGKYEHERWQERSGRWPDDRDRFLAEALERAEHDDVYVAPYLRSNASRRKGSALPSSWLYGDVDEAADGQLRTPAGVLLLGPGGLLVDPATAGTSTSGCRTS